MIPALHCIVLDADAATRAGVVRIVRGLAGVSIEEASSGRDAAALVGGDARSVVFAGIADDSVSAFGEAYMLPCTFLDSQNQPCSFSSANFGASTKL